MTPRHVQSVTFVALAIAVVVTGGCHSVNLEGPGDHVTVMHAEVMANCDAVGVVTATTQTKDIADLGPKRVRMELETLARNDAGKLGADIITPMGSPHNGEQSFRAYRCTPT